MTATNSPRVGGGSAYPRGLIRYLRRPVTVRRQLDNALAAIGACALVTAALRITDLIAPHLLGGIHP